NMATSFEDGQRLAVFGGRAQVLRTPHKFPGRTAPGADACVMALWSSWSAQSARQDCVSVCAPDCASITSLLVFICIVKPGRPSAKRSGSSSSASRRRSMPVNFQLGQVLVPCLRRQFEVFSQSLIEPQRDILEHAVQQGMRQLVPQVVANALAPERVDKQVLAVAAAVWLRHKEGPAFRQLRIAGLHEALVAR